MKKGEGGREIRKVVSVAAAAAGFHSPASNTSSKRKRPLVCRTLKLLRTNTLDECPDTQPSALPAVRRVCPQHVSIRGFTLLSCGQIPSGGPAVNSQTACGGLTCYIIPPPG